MPNYIYELCLSDTIFEKVCPEKGSSQRTCDSKVDAPTGKAIDGTLVPSLQSIEEVNFASIWYNMP